MLALLARTDSVHPPLPGPSVLEMKLRATVYHSGLPVAFVGVDDVLPAVLHFFDVDVGSQPEDVGIPGAQACHHEVRETHAAVGCPLLVGDVL